MTRSYIGEQRPASHRLHNTPDGRKPWFDSTAGDGNTATTRLENDMGTGFGYLHPDLREIRCTEYGGGGRSREREYRLSCSWASSGSWVDIDGIETDDIEGDRLSIPMAAAKKIAAAILLSHAESIIGQVIDPGTSTEGAYDAFALERLCRGLLGDSLDTDDDPRSMAAQRNAIDGLQ